MSIFKFKLEAKVKDRISGFEGIIMGRTEYSTGCVQYGVAPDHLDKDGKVMNWHWFDEKRLKLVKTNKQKLKDEGGPHPTAPSM